jgi:hypothetical protein
MRAFYFGCFGELGHYWWSTSLREKIFDTPQELGRGLAIDGIYAPFGREIEGSAQIVYMRPPNQHKAWTIIAFWDRSVDKRSGSNSAFVLEGVYPFEDALHIAKGQFPDVFKRFTFPITRWEPPAV